MPTSPLLIELANSIETASGRPTTISSTRNVSGGCINNAFLLEASDRRCFFIKTNLDAPPEMFATETAGLQAMSATNTIRIPTVICCGELESGGSFLVLEAIQSQPKSNDFFTTFGRQLAEMHRAGTSDRFGFESDNWLGATTQPNPWNEDWTEFWNQSRLEHQLKLAHDRGHSDKKLQLLGSRLLNRIHELFGNNNEPPALIHGDLWNGNYLCDESGQPVLIDPACYYANREAEFGMTTLFGGFPREFYDAYLESWPMDEGWKSRVEIYRLYHLLNHLNLFGRSYLDGCIEILERHA